MWSKELKGQSVAWMVHDGGMPDVVNLMLS